MKCEILASEKMSHEQTDSWTERRMADGEIAFLFPTFGIFCTKIHKYVWNIFCAPLATHVLQLISL